MREGDPVRAAGATLVAHPKEPRTRAFRPGLQNATCTETQKT